MTRAVMIAGVASLALIAPAFAYVSSDGHEYELTCNASGYILESKHPTSRMIGRGAGTQIVRGIERLYLGKNCDAFNQAMGSGSWCWANGGFVADLENGRVGFPRQELFCPRDENEAFALDCWCE